MSPAGSELVHSHVVPFPKSSSRNRIKRRAIACSRTMNSLWKLMHWPLPRNPTVPRWASLSTGTGSEKSFQPPKPPNGKHAHKVAYLRSAVRGPFGGLDSCDPCQQVACFIAVKAGCLPRSEDAANQIALLACELFEIHVALQTGV